MQNENQPYEPPDDGQKRMAFQQSLTSKTSSGHEFMAPRQLNERLNVSPLYSEATTSSQVVHQDSAASDQSRVFTGDLNSQLANHVPQSNVLAFKVHYPTAFIVNGVDKATRAKLLTKQMDYLIKRELKVYHASRDRNEYLASMGFASHKSTKDQNQETLVQSQNSNDYVIISAYDQQHVIQQSPSSMPNCGPMDQPMMQSGHPQAMNNVANNYQVGNFMMTGSIDSPQTMNYQQHPQQGHDANMYAQQQPPQQFQSHPMHSQSANNIMAGQPGRYGSQQSSPYHQQNMHQQIVQQQTPPQQQYANNFNVPQQHQQGILRLNNSNPITLSPLPSAASIPQNMNVSNFNQNPRMINSGSNATYQMGNKFMTGQPGQYGNQQSSPYHQPFHQNMHQQHIQQHSLMQQQTPPQQHLITSSSSPSLMGNTGAPQQQHGNNFNVPQQQPIQQHQQGNLMLNNSNPITTSSPTPMSPFINSNPMQQQGGQSLIDSPGKANIIHTQQQPQQAPGGMNMMNTRPQQLAPSPSPSAASMQQNMNVGNFNQNPRMINPGSNAAYQMGNDMNSGNMAGNAVNSSYSGGYAVNANSNGGQMGQGQAQYPQQTFVGNQASQPQMVAANTGAPIQNQQGAQPATTTASSEYVASLIQEQQQQRQMDDGVNLMPEGQNNQMTSQQMQHEQNQENQPQIQLDQNPEQQNIQDVSNQDQQMAFLATTDLPFEFNNSVEEIDLPFEFNNSVEEIDIQELLEFFLSK